jgi:hypothetical protein
MIITQENTALLPGDIFNVVNQSAILQALILWKQRRMSWDGAATYGHSGLITDSDGTTFESGIKVKGLNGFRHGAQNIWTAYSGVRCQIIRHAGTTSNAFRETFQPLHTTLNGQPYPLWRLPLFLFGPKAARRMTWIGLGVCSETCAKPYAMTFPVVTNGKLVTHKGLGYFRYWAGIYPDWLADLPHNVFGRKGWWTVAEGVIA